MLYWFHQVQTLIDMHFYLSRNLLWFCSSPYCLCSRYTLKMCSYLYSASALQWIHYCQWEWPIAFEKKNSDRQVKVYFFWSIKYTSIQWAIPEGCWALVIRAVTDYCGEPGQTSNLGAITTFTTVFNLFCNNAR